MALGPEGQLPLRLPYRCRQGEAVPAEIAVLRQESIRYLLVFLRQNGAGGIHQHAAGGHILGGVVQQRRLDHRQGEQIVCLFVADVRLLPDDTQTGAGSIHQHRVKPLRPFRTEHPAVSGGGGDGGQVQPGRALLNSFQLVFVEVAGDDLSFVLHGKGGAEGLAAGGGAEIQHLLPRLHAGDQGHQPGGGVLHQQFTLPEGSQRGEIPGSGQFQTAGNPGVGGCCHAPAFQFLYQAFRIGFQGVDLYRQRRGIIIRRQECLRFLPA